MSNYKSAIRAQSQTQQNGPHKFTAEARQLQEMFPSWSNDDLQSLLLEVNGDVDVAAVRIAEGHAEQWGAVSRKKDKKPASAPGHVPKESFSAGKGDFRGGRGGGRGGRGATGRGGAAIRGGRGGSTRPGHVTTNGHASSTPPPVSSLLSSEVDNVSGEGTSIPAQSAFGQDETPSQTVSTISTPLLSSATTASTKTSIPDTDSRINGHTPSVTPSLASKASKTPATSKLSWAQIARPQPKPTPPPVVPIAPPSVPDSPPPVSLSEPEAETSHAGWEDPTTVQVPTWDEDSKPATSLSGAWPASTIELVQTDIREPDTTLAEPSDATTQAVDIPIEKEKESPTLPQVSIPTSTAKPALARAPLSHRSSARHKVTDQPVVLPSSFGNIEKVGMQFGSLDLGGDSIFDINEPEIPLSALSPPTPPPAIPTTPVVPEPAPVTPLPTSTSLASGLSQQSTTAPQANAQPTNQLPHTPLPSSISQPTVSSQQTQISTPTASIHQFTVPTQPAPPAIPQQTSSATSTQQPQQPQLPQQVQHQLLGQHQYSQGLSTHLESQPTAQIQSHQAATQPPQSITQQPQPQSNAAHSNYFRQNEAPYFHTPTPPAAGQPQENPYGAFGPQLTQPQQQQHQHHQSLSHLSSFAAGDYGYNDTQRGAFYDSYQPGSFSGRNALNDDIKGLPGTQQPTASSALPPPNAGASQQHGNPQATGQPQPGGSQGPSLGYAPPGYYYPYPQNQYYGAPYNNYPLPQPFVKYPAMFQHGPPGTGNAPTTAGKQPGPNVGVGVQQNNPYQQASLYGQQGSYDDYQHHAQHQQHQQHQPHQHQHQQHAQGLHLGQSSGIDYGKQLYGNAGAQGGMQGFMGLGGQNPASAGAGVPPTGAPRGGGSPEAAYKPYAPKDTSNLGVGGGRGGSVQSQVQGQAQGQAQGQGQGQGGQGPQGQFYGNRFANSVGGVGGGIGTPQQNTHHQTGPLYGQGQNDTTFYYRNQQYW